MLTTKRFTLVEVEKETVDRCSKCGARIKWSYWILDSEYGEAFPVGSECAYYYQLTGSKIKKAKKEATGKYKALAAVNAFLENYKQDPYDVDDYRSRKPYCSILLKNAICAGTECHKGLDIQFVYQGKVICLYNIANQTTQFHNL